jgi:hypothetical protein
MDRRVNEIDDHEACKACIRNRHKRICVQLVTVGGETKFGVVPMPREKRIGGENYQGFWYGTED